MGRKTIHVVALIALVLAPTTSVQAHHGWSQYHTDQTLTLTRVIHEAAFEHPHATLQIQVEEGKTMTVVLPPPTRAARLGLTAETLKVDMPVTVVGHRHRTVPDEIRALRITLSGRTINLR